MEAADGSVWLAGRGVYRCVNGELTEFLTGDNWYVFTQDSLGNIYCGSSSLSKKITVIKPDLTNVALGESYYRNA